MVNRMINILIVSILFQTLLVGQNNVGKNIYTVLTRSKIGKNYQFSHTEKDYGTGKNETSKSYIRYLGTIKAMSIIKIISFLSDAGHGNTIIYLFDKSNKYIGEYYLGDRYDLPTEIQKNKLVFIKNNAFCKAKTEIDFSKGIPNEIFLYCKGNSGDIYSFSKIQ